MFGAHFTAKVPQIQISQNQISQDSVEGVTF